MIVIDASAVVGLLLGGPVAARVATHLDDALVAPDLLHVEVCSAFARLVRAGSVDGGAADEAIRQLVRTPVTSVRSSLLLSRAWQLRDRVRVADAFYVACALAFRAPLLTTDARLRRATVPGLAVTLVR